MAFSDALRKLGTFVGLYGKEPEPGYPGDGYEPGYGNEYLRPDEYYGGSYQEPLEEEETVYQTGYGATGPYARAGAKPPKQPQSRYQGSPQGSPGRSRPSARPQQQRPDNVIPMRERETRAPQEPAPRAYEMPKERETEYPRDTRGNNGKTVVFCARRKEESEQIITKMVEGYTVLLNLEELDDMQYRRLLDLVSGAAFAIGASVVRTTHKGYLVAPEGQILMGGDEPTGREPRESREPRDGYYSSSR